jgi:purine-binding chemotaxis protein CheW
MNDSPAGKYLTFILDNEEYGIALLKVKEIIGMMSITTVPQTPEYVKGVINLQGKVIPVSEVMNIKAEEVEEAPSFGTKVETDYILGMANMDGQVKIRLDIDRVLTDDAMARVKHAA